MRSAICNVIILIVLSPVFGQAAEVVRGPYLQTLTSGSVIIKYRTDVAVSSEVAFGPVGGSLATLSYLPAKTDHQVTLLGMSPATDYNYEIRDGSGNPIAAGPKLTFRTAPVPGTSGQYRFWAIGDAGTANADANRVYEAYLTESGGGHTDAWLMLGDNAYVDGTDAQYQEAVFNMYTNLLPNTGLWSTRGNHERTTATYFDNHEHPTSGQAGGVPSGTEAYYAFDYGHVHFVCLDSYESDRSETGAMMTWLKADLAATSAEFIVAYFHHPPYTKGSHDSDNPLDSGGRMQEMRQRFLPVLEDYGTDLVLSGHSHSYERTFSLKGHYGDSATFHPEYHIVNGGDGLPDGDGAYSTLNGTGTVYITAGSSGKVTGTLTRHEAVYAAIYELGSVIMDVSNQVMTVRLLDDMARTRDEFVIRHDVSVLPIVTNDLVSVRLPTNSRIDYELTETGSKDTELRLYYGLSDEGKQLDAWDNVTTVGTFISPTTSFASLSGLADQTTYYYRFFAVNADGGSWSPATGSWTTDASLMPRVEFPGGSFATNKVVIAAGSTWAYDDDNNVDANWKSSSYDDILWDRGPAQLGYGDGDEQTVTSYGGVNSYKHITTWFRHSFVETNPASVTNLNLKLLRDDGAIVYLNGTEVVRDNMPGGAVTKNTTATTFAGGNTENTFFDFTIPIAPLQAGTNTIAVELHQYSRRSSDTSFDLSLDADTLVQEPPAAISNITVTTGLGHTELLNDAGVATQVLIYYGTTDGGTNASAWDSFLSIPATIGIVPFQFTGLIPGTTYFVRASAVNSYGADWSQDTLTFTTLPYTADTDADGLPDGWEFEYFGDIQETDGTGDEDGDGMNDGSEFLAGTDPTDFLSRLDLAILSSLDGSEHVLSWTNTPGLFIDLQQCPDLADPLAWTSLVDNVSNGVFTNIAIPGQRIFYRIKLDSPW